MWDLILEIIRAIVVSSIFIYLWKISGKENIRKQEGWFYILIGFGLILFGMLIDITDNFPGLNHYIVIGDTKYQAFLEKVMGYLFGFILLAVGFWKWMPIVIRLGLTERELKKSHDKLELIVDERTAELSKATESLKKEIDKHKQAEKAMQESEERLKAIFDANPDPIVVYNNQGHPEYLNAAFTEVFGWQLDELKGKRISFVPDAQKEITHAKIDQLFASGKPVRFDTQRLNKQGDTIDVIVSAAAIKGSEAESVGMVVNLTDVTERKRLGARLRQAQKMESIGTLAGGIAHDFNNALYSIIGYTDLTMDDVPEGSLARSNLKEILIAAHRAKNMVQQILTFSRQTEPEKKPVEVQSVVKEAIALLRTSIPTIIEIRQHIDSNCNPVMADPTQIQQVVMNLATNAYHAMREKGGVLSIDVIKEKIIMDDSASYLDFHPGTYLKLSVSDTGHGMDKAIMQKIFDPFFTTKPVGEGTGMGLSIIHGIVKNHGGNIKVYSEPGKGTVFNVYFPMIEAKPVESKILSTRPVQKGSEFILFVDDEETIVRMVRRTLERLGYQVATRTGSVDALEAFRANPDKYDLVITDMNMPNMTGIELAPRLLEIRADIPIILCTGFSDIANEKTAKAMGIREFVMKPVVREEIARTIRKVLDE